jgi:hypothetical protein
MGNQLTVCRIVGGKFCTIGVLDPAVRSDTTTRICLLYFEFIEQIFHRKLLLG